MRNVGAQLDKDTWTRRNSVNVTPETRRFSCLLGSGCRSKGGSWYHVCNVRGYQLDGETATLKKSKHKTENLKCGVLKAGQKGGGPRTCGVWRVDGRALS